MSYDYLQMAIGWIGLGLTIIKIISGQITPSHTSNSDFGNKAKGVTLLQGKCLPSYNVTALLTSVPMDPALNIIKDLLEKDEKITGQNSIIRTEHH